MTPTNDLPSTYEVLAGAYAIVATPCSAAEADRAKVLLGIAKEMREEAQYRAIAGRRLNPLPPPVPAAAEAPPADPDATAVMPLDRGQRMQDDPAMTQRIPVMWSVGDKADCRHCHTPIMLVEVTLNADRGAVTGMSQVWHHKYTGQAVCAVPRVVGEIPGGEEIAHTFAEPSV